MTQIHTEKFQLPLWEQYRDQFPVTERLVYLNHAAVAPLCKPAAQAMLALTEDALQYGGLHYDLWLAAYEGLRVAAAKLLDARPDEIANVKNTSEGLAMVANGIDWRPGDKIVAFREEFPANYYPWKLQESAGVNIEWLSCRDPLEQIDRACRGARLLSISFVQYMDGYRVNLCKIGEICARHNCLFVVDAIQGLGAFPVNVTEARIHALSTSGHKWLLGPEGCGILFVSREVQDLIRPAEFGWTNVAGYKDYSSRDATLRPDAGRYECGTLNTVGCFGLRAAIEFLLQIPPAELARAVQSLGDRIAEGVPSKGYEVMGARSEASGSGIVSFRKNGVDCQLVVRRLREHGIVVAPRLGWIRASPHFYIRPDEIDRMIDLLP